jgi:tetratricopeptide (TPR) repeat protein
MMAHSMVGSVHHSLGNITVSQQYCEASLTEPSTLHRTQMVYLGVDHRNRALCVSARNLWVLGLGDQAIEAANFTIDEGGVVEHPVSLGVAFWTVPVYIWAGDYQRAEEAIERLLARAAKFSLQPYLAMSLGQRGGLAVRQGDPKGGVKLLEEALRIANSSGYTMIVTQYMVNLAEGLLALGRIAQALAVIDRAILRIEASGELLHMPELLRLKGEALAQTGSDEAQAALYASLQCARSQDALAWELRAASSLARLRTSRGNCKEGTEILAGVFSRFREGFGTVDLRAAASLLRSTSAQAGTLMRPARANIQKSFPSRVQMSSGLPSGRK